MAEFDTRTMYSFEKYLDLQNSGERGMEGSEVQQKLGISEAEYKFIVENYRALLEAYKELKVVNEIIADAKNRAEGNELGEKGKKEINKAG